MAFPKVVVFLLASMLGFSECAFVDTLNKCSLQDRDCQKDLIQNVLKNIGETGVPDLGIPPVDPIDLKNMKINILNALDLTILEGTAKGVKNCIINKFEINLEMLHAHLDITCDIVIKAKYDMKSKGDLIKNLMGGDIHGEGNGKVKIEKINIKIDFPIEVEKRGDDTFLKGEAKNYKHTFEILGNITFSADNLYLGDKESSKEIVKMLNENWKLLVGPFGNQFLDIAMSLAYDFICKFFTSTPTKHYVLEDLSQYVK